MKKNLLLAAFVLLIIASLFTWEHATNTQAPKTTKNTVTLALDWTPNTNHTGIYVALAKGWYDQQGIDLKLLPYSASASSDSLVAAGKAHVGVGFTESVVADAASSSHIVSIAAIIAHNTSIIAVRKDSGIASPRQLDNKIFGGYGAPYEPPVMTQVIKQAGGRGDFENITINTDPIEALKSKRVDFVWVYSGWEAIQAKREGLALTTFPITSYGIPDYATPNLITSPQTLKNHHELLKKFMAATARGYEYARTSPDAAAQILIKAAPAGTFGDPGLVTESQTYLSSRYQDRDKPWGIQAKESWIKYPQFMLDKQAVLDSVGKPVKKIDYNSLYTNELLQ